MRRVHVTILAVEKQKVWHLLCVCSLVSPAANEHAPYYIVMWPALLYHISPHNVINGTISKTAIEHKMCVLIFSKTLSKIFLIMGRLERDIVIDVHFLSNVHETSFFDRLSKNNQIQNFIKIHPGRARLFFLHGRAGRRTEGRTDRQA